MSTEEPLRAALLARVSTEMQEEGFSIAAQLEEMRDYCDRRGWVPVVEFIDAGYTGSTMDRPGLLAMLSALDQGAFDVAVVHELSRLSRSIYDTFSIFEQLGEHSVGFASVKEPDFDFTTPAGRLFLTMMAALNQYYLDILRIHTAKGKRQRARQGLYNTSITPFGYRPAGDAQTPPEVDPEAAEGVRLAFETYAAGKSSDDDVAQLLNDAGYRTVRGRRFSKDAVRDILRNRFYVGDVVYGTKRRGQPPEYYPGQHEAIVSQELFDACQEVRRRRRGAPRTYQRAYRVYLLNGVALCDVCRRTLRGQATKSARYYREMSRIRGYVDCPSAQVGTKADEVENQVEQIVRLLRLPEDWQQRLELLLARDDDLVTIEKQRERLEAEKRRLKVLYIRGEFEEDIALYEREKRRIERDLQSLPPSDLTAIERAANTLEELNEVWDDADPEDQRDLLRLVLLGVHVDVGQGRVVALQPYPPFIPLFRESPLLAETEPGLFVLLWPPDLAEEASPGPPLEPVRELPPPSDAVLWPFILALPQEPEDDRQRITPVLSKLLKARRRKKLSVGKVVDVLHPGISPLKVDSRKWPDVELDAVTLDPDQPRLPYGDGAVSLLRTPFFLQQVSDKEGWLAEIERVLGKNGWWMVEDVMPASMPAHWLYQFFPETRKVDAGQTFSPRSLFVTLKERGFQVKLQRQTYDQAVTLGVLRQIVEERGRIPQLAVITDLAYQAGVDRIEAELEAKGSETLWRSQICVVEAMVTRGKQKGRR